MANNPRTHPLPPPKDYWTRGMKAAVASNSSLNSHTWPQIRPCPFGFGQQHIAAQRGTRICRSHHKLNSAMSTDFRRIHLLAKPLRHCYVLQTFYLLADPRDDCCVQHTTSTYLELGPAMAVDLHMHAAPLAPPARAPLPPALPDLSLRHQHHHIRAGHPCSGGRVGAAPAQHQVLLEAGQRVQAALRQSLGRVLGGHKLLLRAQRVPREVQGAQLLAEQLKLQAVAGQLVFEAWLLLLLLLLLLVLLLVLAQLLLLPLVLLLLKGQKQLRRYGLLVLPAPPFPPFL